MISVKKPLMKTIIKNIYSKDIQLIYNTLNINTNIFIYSLDIYILEIAIDEISKKFKSDGYLIYKPSTKIDIEEKSLYIIDINNRNILYYYLEMCNKVNIKILFFSRLFIILDNLEKRVKSRFSNIILVLDKLTREQYIDIYKYKVSKDININKKLEYSLEENIVKLLHRQYDINPTISSLLNIYLKFKYDIPEYRLIDTLKYLNNVHLSILILCHHTKILYFNVVSEYKKFINRIKELKNTKNKEILNCYEEITDMGLISEKGSLLIDFNDLKNFICSNSPQYLKKLFTYIQL